MFQMIIQILSLSISGAAVRTFKRLRVTLLVLVQVVLRFSFVIALIAFKSFDIRVDCDMKLEIRFQRKHLATNLAFKLFVMSFLVLSEADH
jgi:hypothetical protein